MARLGLVALLAVGLTACSSSKPAATTTATTPAKSPIVVKTPVPGSQWRSPLTVRGRTSLAGKLTAEVLDDAGKQLGSEDTSPRDGRFSVQVRFSVKQLTPGAVLVHDADSSHSVQIQVVLTP
jgi:hypothetical protein